jgi:hypothetical protein
VSTLAPLNRERRRCAIDDQRQTEHVGILQLLLGYERRKQHVLDAHERRDIGFHGQNDVAFLVHDEPFEATAE